MFKFFTAFSLLLVTIIGVSFLWYRHALSPLTSTENYQQIIIPKGSSAQRVAEILAAKKLIRNPFAFRIYTKLAGKHTSIQAGQFRLSPHLSTDQIIDKLGKGEAEGIWVTFLEGWRREQFAIELNQALESPDSPFTLSEFLQLTTNKEGYLFPDTYLIPKTASASAIASILENTFNQKTQNLENGSPIVPSTLSLKQAIILASIVEREAAREADLPIVAGILINRIRQHSALQVDATLQYAKINQKCLMSDVSCLLSISDWWPQPYAQDKQINSPYNTYQHPGLPPSPISNPGLATIRAVLNPTDTDYWYYLTDDQGNMHYAVTLEQHNQNVQKFLR